jgi:Na+/melibiose symporter-like transporter
MRLIRGRSKARAAAWMALGVSVALPGLALVPPGGAAIAFVAILLLGFPSAANTALFDSLMGDIAAADARKGGRSRAGLYYALHMVVGRLGRGAAIAVAFWALDRVGFHPGTANPAATADVFRLIYVAAPMGLQLAMAGLLWTYPEPAPERA